ncbi:MAG TPA: nuclear transport factor 2 family protein [Candidatus Angelobacter sp.]|nr:nuclear transport factor 2 family protein [Candidatus Angelobacter sp.]
MSANPIEVVLKFEQAINSRKVDAIVAMCTDDSVFVDSIGSKVRGRDKLKNAWEGYLKVVPDYRISHEEIFGHGDTVAVFGSAGGTFAPDGKIVEENQWHTPAAWHAVVRGEKIALWQVFADNEPIRAIMRRKPRRE